MRRREALNWLGALTAGPAFSQGTDAPAAVDVAYGPLERNRLDVYRPTTGNGKAVLVIHGGAWRGGSKEGHRRTAAFLTRNGYTAFVMNYRLAPKDPYPACLLDCQRAVRWVRANAGRYGADATRLGALGDSAGGHLVSMLGVLRRPLAEDRELRERPSHVDAVVNYYGPCDLRRLYAVEGLASLLEELLGGSPAERPDMYAAASPLTHIDHGAAPHLIFHGVSDPIVPWEQAELLTRALERKRVPHDLHLFPGAGHGWPRESAAGVECERAILAFYQRWLHSKTRP